MASPQINPGDFTPGQLAAFEARKAWLDRARPEQIPPPGEWNVLIWRCGRGFGKTVSLVQAGWWEAWRVPGLIVHWVAPTLSDLRKVAFEGPVGFCNIIPRECLKGGSLDVAYNKTHHTLELSNGSIICGFSATEQGGRLRGPQCHLLLCDELREWDRPKGNLEEAFNNAEFGCRLVYPDGTPTRVIGGTTPRNIPFLKRLYRTPGTILISRSAYDNIKNLAKKFQDKLIVMEGTKLAKAEIYGADTEDEDTETIFKRSWFKLWPRDKKMPEFIFILESYDTAGTEENFDPDGKRDPDYTACVVFGIFNIKAYFTEQEIRKYNLRGRHGALIWDVWQDRLGFPDLLDRARKQHRMRIGAAPGRRADIVLIEEKGTGPALRQMMNTWGVPTWKFNPGNQSKTVRGTAMSPVVKNGAIFLPESKMPGREGLPRNWCEPFLEQVCSFIVEGSTEYDDMYDSFVQGVHYLQERDLIRAEPEIKFLDPEEKREHDEKEAMRYHRDEQARESVNPYGE